MRNKLSPNYLRRIRLSKAESIPAFHHNTEGPTSLIGESADVYTHSSYSGNDDLKEKVLVRTISNLNERVTRNNHELPHFNHTQKYLIDKEEYLNVDLIKIEANSGSPSITSHEFPYSYVYYPIELEAPKSVQNVDIDDENASINFT